MRTALLPLLALASGTACSSTGSPISGPPDVPHVPDAKTDVDVNGDGLADVILVGLEGQITDCPINTGCTEKLYVWFGNEDFAFDSSAPSQIFENHWSQIFAAGDANGDGYTDLWGGGDAGVGLFIGGPDGLTTFIDTGSQAPGWHAGDVNCDGYSDFGHLFGILYGGPDATTLVGEQIEQGDNFERFPGGIGLNEVATWVGDTNGDGCDDLVYDAELVFGGPNGMTPSGIFPATTQSAAPGHNDLNGDGLADVMTNTPWLGDSSGNILEGPYADRVYVPTAATGDITGDGIADALWGDAPSDANPRGVSSEYDRVVDEYGLLYSLYRGGHELYAEGADPWLVQAASDEVLEYTASTTAAQQAANPFEFYPSFWGQTMGSVGDIDGDGYRDYVIKGLDHISLYRGGDRLDRRSNAAGASLMLGVSGEAGIAGLTDL